MRAAETTQITEDHRRQFQDEGYFILERALSEEALKGLRHECAESIERIHTLMDKQNTDTLGISHRGKRYFIGGNGTKTSFMRPFLFSDLMVDLCKATLGDTAYLFFEQFVVKAGEKGIKFGWHQDSGYIPYEHAPYLTIWMALDDVTEENGTVYILPFSHTEVRTRVEHVIEEGTNDKVGYHGDDPGIPAIVPAGSLVVFSSLTFHRSSANMTKNMRRAYIAQYSTEPIIEPDTGMPRKYATPIVQNGQKAFEREYPPL